jgi:hypothetical protein
MDPWTYLEHENADHIDEEAEDGDDQEALMLHLWRFH